MFIFMKCIIFGNFRSVAKGDQHSVLFIKNKRIIWISKMAAATEGNGSEINEFTLIYVYFSAPFFMH